jgi:hypothetical protein
VESYVASWVVATHSGPPIKHDFEEWYRDADARSFWKLFGSGLVDEKPYYVTFSIFQQGIHRWCLQWVHDQLASENATLVPE